MTVKVPKYRTFMPLNDRKMTVHDTVIMRLDEKNSLKYCEKKLGRKMSARNFYLIKVERFEYIKNKELYVANRG